MSDRARTMVVIILAHSLVVFALHLSSVRPYLWPAGAGVTVSGDTLFGILSTPHAVPRIRPPHLRDADLASLTATRVNPAGDAARLGVTEGMTVAGPATVEDALLAWRERYRRGPDAAVELVDAATRRVFAWTPRAVWEADAAARREWWRTHLGAILQMTAFLAGACILVALGTRGPTAVLVTLAMIFTAIANGGLLLGAEWRVPFIAPALMLFEWTATAASFPIIGLAILHFPSRAPVLSRFPWIPTALPLLPLPVLFVSVTTMVFLLGVDAALAPLAWFSANGWLFDAAFAVALAANVLIVIEGVHRYQTVVDADERRRIQIVVYTSVPAVLAYAIKAGAPLVAALAGRAFAWPWVLEGVLQGIVLLPAFALPYAVAVKHVFSPRTVLRRSLQYALARRTLSVLILLPVLALAASLISQRDRALGDIILGQPIFYALAVALLALGLRYRDQAQRALDKQFFRVEYDAREILVALAHRVPFERDAARLVETVVADVDHALHPESVAVLAGDDAMLEVVASVRARGDALPRTSAIVTLLQWSDEPLAVFLDDERSPARRLPAADRAWLAAGSAALLVPIFGGAAAESERALLGVMILGQKKSEEPYTPEDRKLLSGIASQMSVALDLSRLRKRESSGVDSPVSSATPTLTPTMVAETAVAGGSTLTMCPLCHRCYDLLDVRRGKRQASCPADGTLLQPVIGMPPIIDNKYRVDAVIGRGGMGAVFRARDLRLERDVAVKIVRADLMAGDEARARFQREAQIVARLQHPAIVIIFDYGTLSGGAAYLVMEYVHGEDLRHRLKRERVLPPPVAVELLSGVATGVDAAHRAGVLHRDLKPENILLPTGGTTPKVLDFGVAKMADSTTPAGDRLTQGGTIIGTPAYMSPEQLRGEVIDARADVFSLAVVTFETLTGRLPFGTGSFVDLALRQRRGVDAIDCEGLPANARTALRRALSLDREERPATAAGFAAELRLLL
jgi:GAF domain-containing protein/predicted Ser/Thr protein kinase